MNEVQSENLRHLTDQKNKLALEMQLKELSIPAETKNNLLKIPMMFGGEEVLKSAMVLAETERCMKALENLDVIYRMLKNFGLSRYIAIDLGMVHSLNYYTGMIFRGMTGIWDILSAAAADMTPWFQNLERICPPRGLLWT